MAYRARYQKYRAKYASRRFGRARAVYKSGGGSVIFALGGVVAGYMAPRVVPYQDLIVTGVAVAPGVLPVGKAVPWQLRRAASGYVLGAIIRNFLPSILGQNAATGGDYI